MTDNETLWRRIDHAITLTENVHEHLDDSAESNALLKVIDLLEQANLDIENYADEPLREDSQRAE